MKTILKIEEKRAQQRKRYADNRDRLRINANAVYHRNKQKYRKNRLIYNRFYKYGITEDQYIQLLIEQNSSCAICDKPFNLNNKNETANIDHDHRTGKIRKLLCRKCNLLLSNAEENQDRLYKAAEYLEKFKTLV